ncbi:hypothetical protein [Pseudomonas brassicacearum]|uniref:Uncharacterized protein n=1 Tax=Pseudomonas brassicacearum TaxID=930166 RepID=A0A423GX18_9PSED|nr:hypothetical protein [Pseudomonas brassicacearum]RON02456.1 hypothetical protein BK658_06190 [Pseudomonas brassicacearum]
METSATSRRVTADPERLQPAPTLNNTSASRNREAEAQHIFERLIIGRTVLRKGWRLWVMSELFKLNDGPLRVQVKIKLLSFLKDTHYN